ARSTISKRCGRRGEPRARTHQAAAKCRRGVPTNVRAEFAYRDAMEYPHPLSPGSTGLDARELDHLAPLLGIFCDEFSEFSRRHRHRHSSYVGKPCLHLWIGKARIDLFVKLVDNLGGHVLWTPDAIPTARLVARHEFTHGRNV